MSETSAGRGAAAAGGALALAFLALGSLSGCADSAPGEGAEGQAEGTAGEARAQDPDPAERSEAQRDADTGPEADPEADGETDAEPDVEADAGTGPGAAPQDLRIPSIDIDEELIDLGIAADGTMEVPQDWDDVGWFTGGGRPGAHGPTVLAGHLDSTTGPAVFYRLLELEPGDEVEVTDAEGERHDYTVDRVEDHPKDDFPTGEVFGATEDDELRLITCTGEFDEEVSSHEDNRIVFATPSS